MGQLYDLKVKIEAKIKADGLDANEIRGKLGLRSGKLLSFINANTPDEAEAIAKLRSAANEILRANF